MPSISYSQIIKKIKKEGFYLARQAKGSHEIWTNGKARMVIPNHRGNMPIGTVSKIVKAAGYKSITDFLK